MGKTVNIGGRIHNPEVGNVVAGANEILDDSKGKKQNVINGEVDTALAGLDSGKQDKLTFDQTPTESSTNPVTSGGVYAANLTLQQAIEAILLLIPSAASALNKLADVAFVNSSIATASATFRGTYNLVSDLHLSVSASHQDIATALASAVATADNNDYCFVQIPTSDTSSDIRVTERYKFDGTAWQYEYDLNNSGFTAQQWAAINSTITSALVGKLSALPTADELAALLAGKQATLTFDNAPVSGSSNPVKSGGLYELFAAIDAKMPAGASANNKLVAESRLAEYVTAIIGSIDASFDLTSADGHVTFKMTQADGVITSVQILTSDIASAAALTLLGGRVSTNENDIADLQEAYAALTQNDIIVVNGALPSSDQQQNVIYRQPDQDHTPPQFYSDYMWNGSTWVLMATYNNAIDPRPKKGSQNLVTSGGVFDNMGALDVSELNATENPHTLATYADLSAALAAIPSDYQKGGMSIKFVQSSDNTYVQYFLTKNVWSIDTNDWEKMNLESAVKNIEMFTCETIGSSVAKVVNADGFSLIPGGCIKIRFTHANTTLSPTLNINSTGAKKVIYNGSEISSTNTWEDNAVVEFYYDPSGDSGSGAWIGRNIGYDSILNFSSTKSISNKDIAESVFSYQLESGYYLTTIGNKPAFAADDNLRTILIKAKKGDVYSLKGRGTLAAKLWFTCDQYRNIVRVSDIEQSNTPIDVTIANGEEWIGFNSYASFGEVGFYKKLYILNKIKDIEEDITELGNTVYGLKEENTYALTGNKSVKNDFSLFANEGEVVIRADYDSSDFTRLQLVANDEYNVSHATTLQPNVSYRFKCYGYNVILAPIFASGVSESDVSLYVNQVGLKDSIDDNVASLKQAIGIKNNLVSDGFGTLPNDTIVLKNGTPSASNYGLDNVIYAMTLPKADKYRIFFRWKFTAAVPYVSNSATLPLLRFGKDGSTRFQVQPSVWPRKLANNTGYLVPQYLLGLNNYNVASNTFPAEGYIYRPIMGGFAFIMRFTGDATLSANQDIVAVISDSSITFKHSTNDTVIESVSYNGTDTIDVLVDAINALTDFEATGINVVGHTCADIITNADLSIQMVSTYNTSSYDANPVYVPLAHDTSWHTLELLIDNVNNTSWLAIDGMTNKAAFNALQTYELEIGSTYNGSDSPLSIKDLEINIDSWADAEVVTYKTDPQDTSSSEMTEQIISNHNPRLLLFEGHGMNDCMDVDAPTTPEGLMAASTDRLLYLFDTLKNKGYMPITWSDVIDWKINGKELPKRCYTLMFDDFRIENYVDYAKRKPFEKYNVKPGLALITGNRTRDEQVIVDGKQYDLGRVFDMITLAGWHPCSHTSNHRSIVGDAYSQEAALLKQDVLECNDLGIYSDIIVYPYGSLDIKHTPAMMNSCFQIGVYIASKMYNSMASGNFYLTRYETGTRVTIEQMLMPIV